MRIERKLYLDQLIRLRGNHTAKIITGLRRAGKSYLLFKLFYEYLLADGVEDDDIIRIRLDSPRSADLLDSQRLLDYIDAHTQDESHFYYIFLDEIQMVPGFELLVNTLVERDNCDVYITGSNSRFLSSDIATEFRGRGFEVRVYPLSFAEFVSAYKGSADDAWRDYWTYGGMPQVALTDNEFDKAKLLKYLLENIYTNDIVERYQLNPHDNYLESIMAMLASATGSLTNPSKIAKTFLSHGQKITHKGVSDYIGYLTESFLISKAERYDIKGKKYISTPSKYYFADVGLRNACLNFRQDEENHIMENIIYNELLARGLNVDVGVVEYNGSEDGKRVHKQYEVDFVCNQASQRYYIQSAFAIPDREKLEQEERSLSHIDDSFKKIIILRHGGNTWHSEKGVTIMEIKDFLLDPDSLER